MGRLNCLYATWYSPYGCPHNREKGKILDRLRLHVFHPCIEHSLSEFIHEPLTKKSQRALLRIKVSEEATMVFTELATMRSRSQLCPRKMCSGPIRFATPNWNTPIIHNIWSLLFRLSVIVRWLRPPLLRFPSQLNRRSHVLNTMEA